MIWTSLKLSDNVHYLVEKLTCATAPSREPVAKEYKTTRILITDRTNEILSLYATPRGVPAKGASDKSYQKKDLCSILVTAYYKNWQSKEADKVWQASESQELRKICIDNVDKMRQKIKNIGAFKITKQMMFTAILHRLASTQDLKEFFEKTL